MMAERKSMDGCTSSRSEIAHGCDIAEAERIALADPAWRRWVERQINTDIECRRMAQCHIRYRGG